MPLETGTQIGDLDPANPPGTDLLAEADDHLRLLKICVLGSLGPMPALWTIATNDQWISEANFADNGFVNMIKVNASDEVEIGGPALVAGDLTVSGTLSPAGLAIPNQVFITGRNFADTGVINMMKVNASDVVEIGGPTLVAGDLTVTGLQSSFGLSASDSRVVVNGNTPFGFAAFNGTNRVFFGHDGVGGANPDAVISNNAGTALAIFANAGALTIPNGVLTISTGKLVMGGGVGAVATVGQGQVGAAAAQGLQLIGNGTNQDLTIYNKAAGIIMNVATGTVNASFKGNISGPSLYLAGGLDGDAHNNADDLIIGAGSLSHGITINAGIAGAIFFPGLITTTGGIEYLHSADSMSFYVNGSIGMVIESTHNLSCQGDVTAFAP